MLTATLAVTSGGAVSFLSQTAGSTVGVAYNSGTDTYTLDDTEGVAPGPVDLAFTYTQVTSTEATLVPVHPGIQNFTSLTFNQNVEYITYNVKSLGAPTGFVDTSLPTPSGPPLTDTFDFGTTGLAQSLITASAEIELTKESAAITIDDSQDSAAQTINLSAIQVDFNGPAVYLFPGTNVTSLTVKGGSGANTFNVNNTNAHGPTTLDTGTGADTVDAFASSAATLTINGQAGTDTVTLGALTGVGMDNLMGNVTVTNAAGTTALTLDDSQDMGIPGETVTLTNNGTTGTEQGQSPGTVTYTNSELSSLTVDNGTGGYSVTVTGIPPAVPTLINTGSGNDLVTVVGSGLVSGTNSSDFTINGGAGTNTLVIDSTGTTANLSTHGIVSFGNGTSFGYANFNAIQSANTAPVISISPVSPFTTAKNAPLGNIVIATFTDPDTIENATSYTATINWGDGSTMSAGTIAFTGTSTVGGVTVNDYNITGTHTYLVGGTYTTSVILTDLGGTFNSVVGGIPVTLDPLAPITGTGASVIVSALAPGSPPTAVTATAGILLPLTPLVTFTDGPAPLSPSDYIATIDWGDGTGLSGGTISFAAGVFTISGRHDYSNVTGTPYTITVAVAGDSQQLTETAPVTVLVTPLNGKLSPQSDSGVSNSVGITNVTTPTFEGDTAPGATVNVFAAPSGSAMLPGSLIASGTADSAGVWSATVYTPLADGTYTTTAEVVNDSSTILATASLGTVVIDNVGPVISNLTFDRFSDTVTVTYQDNLSGLDYASIANSSFYHMSAKPLASDVPVPKLLLPTSILITPGATPSSPEVVQVVFNNGHAVRGGRYLIEIDSGTGDTGIQDIADNALDGNFYGVFPSGDAIPGGNFVVAIDTFHNNIILPFVPVKDGYVPPNAAVDPPTLAKPPTKKALKTTHPKERAVDHTAKQAKLVDHALHSLSTGTKPRHQIG
ncbi:MAG: beta strand repeat-containing protein [Isosphaeraceae bacterium]